MESATLAHPIDWQLLGSLAAHDAASALVSFVAVMLDPLVASLQFSLLPGIGINGHIAFIEPPVAPHTHIPAQCYVTHIADCNRKVESVELIKLSNLHTVVALHS
jgi:6-phosphogluconolactonase/glucosamine-6-phosphate isomerase/deaminase